MPFAMYLGEWQEFNRLLFCGSQGHYELCYIPRKKALKVLKQVPARMLRWLSGEGQLAMCLRVSIDSHLRVSIH